MAEIATIARPYAEALFKAAGANGPLFKGQVAALAAVTSDPALRQMAENPKSTALQVFDTVAGVALQKGITLDGKVASLLRVVLDNGRMSAMPAIAQQFAALVNAQSGVADALIESAFPLEGAPLADLVATLEKRFGRKLNAQVQVNADLIGGVRVTVGDQVLDTSVKARLAQMQQALVA